MTRSRLLLLGMALIVSAAALAVWWHRSPTGSTAKPAQQSPGSGATANTTASDSSPDLSPTSVSAHNLLLRKGPNFRFYVRWLHGQLSRVKRNVDPSFDDPESFYLDIKSGVLRANIGDITNFLNSGGLSSSPLKNIKISGDGDQVKMSGTMHKVIPIPVEIRGTLSAISDNQIRIHVKKLDVMKIPVKGLLKGFHVSLADLFPAKGIEGVQVTDNDITFDPGTLLPPPHIRGHLSAIRIANPDLEEVYGTSAADDLARTEQWRNFLRLSGGTLDFGKLTMRHVDLIMIDISKDPWFDIDLVNYQAQLVNGYTHMTPEAGLQIFMPDLRELPPTKANRTISLQWMKNRNLPPPASVYAH